MGILLTDEELWEADKLIPDSTAEDSEDIWRCERYYLKAQLKKVAEWLKSEQSNPDHNLDYQLTCQWLEQALLKEVE